MWLSTYFYGLRFSGTSICTNDVVRLVQYGHSYHSVLLKMKQKWCKKCATRPRPSANSKDKIDINFWDDIGPKKFKKHFCAISFFQCDFHTIALFSDFKALWIWKVKVGVHRGHAFLHMRLCQQLI